MMHLVAMQRLSDNKWHFTCNGVPTGYCAGSFDKVWPLHPDDTSSVSRFSIQEYDSWRERALPFAQHYHDHAHETREQAEECYKKYLLDQRMHIYDGAKANSLHRCCVTGCDKFSGGYIRVGGYSLFILCDEHRNRETLESIFDVGEAWES